MRPRIKRRRAIFVLPFDVSYELDVWGRIRQRVAASREQAQALAADLQSVKLILHAELAFDYFELRSADAQKRLLDSIVQSYRDALGLTTSRFDEGAAPKSDVTQARTQLDSALVADTDIAVERAQYEHAIAVLAGEAPSALSIPEVAPQLVPPGIPVGLPSQLLERRPDIAAAERRVAEANEEMGIARTAFYPTVSLEATLGFTGPLHHELAHMAQPLLGGRTFDGADPVRRGTTPRRVRERSGELRCRCRRLSPDGARGVPTGGGQSGGAAVLEREAQQQQEATASARESLELVTNRYREGADPYLQVLTAQTIALANERNDIDILRRRIDASVLLIKALGGGWDSASLPKAADLR